MAPSWGAALPRDEEPPPAATPSVWFTLDACYFVERGTRRGAIAPAFQPSCNQAGAAAFFGSGDQRPFKVLLGCVCSENKLRR